jgi:phage terminase large subunit-like protein
LISASTPPALWVLLHSLAKPTGSDGAKHREAAFVLVFPLADRFAVLPFFWVPEEGARLRERKDRVSYQEWVREGLIEATPGETIDYERIRARINELGGNLAL